MPPPKQYIIPQTKIKSKYPPLIANPKSNQINPSKQIKSILNPIYNSIAASTINYKHIANQYQLTNRSKQTTKRLEIPKRKSDAPV